MSSLGDRKRILLVDDDETFRHYLAAALEADAFEVTQVASGGEALEVVRSACPDLIVLDVQMPGMDGFEVCRRLRGRDRSRRVPVLMLTASSSEKDILKGFDVGADDFLSKPISLGQFRAKVRAWIMRRSGAR